MVTLVGGVASAAFGTPLVIRGCFDRSGFFLVTNASQFPALAQKDRNGDNIVCCYTNTQGTSFHYTDNNH